MLHVAPEMYFLLRFRRIRFLSYISIDLTDPRAQQRMNLTNLTFPDEHFDAIYCSHVLEHIENDL